MTLASTKITLTSTHMKTNKMRTSTNIGVYVDKDKVDVHKHDAEVEKNDDVVNIPAVDVDEHEDDVDEQDDVK